VVILKRAGSGGGGGHKGAWQWVKPATFAKGVDESLMILNEGRLKTYFELT
jgi:hypothetical protein